MGRGEGISVAAARPGDGAEILAVQRLAFAPAAELYSVPDLPPLVETADRVERDIAEHTVLVAREGERVVGSVRGERRGECVYVGRLSVHPELRRRGIAARLMRELESRFPEATCFELITGEANEPGMRLYEKFGYAESARQRVSANVEIVHMRKAVARQTSRGT